MRLTNGEGADLIVETGGAATFARSVNAAAHGGTVFLIGFLTGAQVSLDAMPIIVKALSVQGNNTGSVADLRDAARAVAASRIQPVIDRTFGVDQTARAYAHLAAGGQHFGKVVITHSW